MSIIKVDYATMDEAARSLQTTRDEINSLLQDFTSAARPLMDSMAGEEKARLETVMAQTQRDFDGLSAFVDQQRAAVVRHAENTNATDRAQAAKWA